MKKARYIVGLMLIEMIALSGYGQTKGKYINLKASYRGAGIIFASDYKLPIIIEDGAKRFNPSVSNVIKAEKLLLSNSDDVKYDDRLIGMYEPSKLKKQLCSYNRQYVGYQNAAGDSIILINLLNFKNIRKAKEYFPDWERSYIFGFGDFYEKNQTTILVNLAQKQVYLP